MHTDRPSVRHSHPSASRQARHQQRVAAWRRAFDRFLPFTGWRVPVLVESAVAAFGRQIGFERIIARGPLSTNSRSAALAIDFSRGIWRSSTLESLEQRRLMALTVGVEEAYVDDSWAGATEGQLLLWTTAAGSEIPLVYGYDAFSTLADGVAALDAGGTLSIAEGTYSEVLATAGKGLTIRAGGDGAAEVTLDGLFLGQGDTLDFDLPSVADYDRFLLTAGGSQLDFGSATLALGSVGDLPTDGSAVLGLVSAEPGLFLGATGTLYDRTGRALTDEAIISSSRLDFRFEKSSGNFAGIFLTPLVPQDEVTVNGLGSPLSLDGSPTFSANSVALVYVYDVWAGAATGAPVTFGSISATYGTNAFSTIGEGLSGVANAGTVQVIAGAGGVYNERLTITQDVTIQGIEPGAPPSTDMGASAGAATLDGSGLFGAGITVNGAGIDLVLQNINLQNWFDGSLLVQAGGTATVTNITLNGDLSGVASVQRGMRLEAGTLAIDKSIFQAANGYGANNAIQVTGGTFTMTASSVTGSSSVNQAGLAISGGTAAVSTSYVTGNFYGVLFSNASSGSVTGSDLSGNTVSALRNIASGGVIIDASTNWWGVTAQADVLSKVFSNSGSRVDITPYLLDGTDSSATAGFQADASQLAVTALGAQFGGTGRIQEGVNSIANGSLTGINRLLFVNDGTYTGGTDVNQSLTLQAATLALAANFTTSAAVTLEEVTDGGGTVIGVTGAGNNIAINSNTSFSGNGSLTLSSANGSIGGFPGGLNSLVADELVLAAPAGSILAYTTTANLTATANGDITVSDSAAEIQIANVTSAAGDVSLSGSGNLTVGTAVEATAGNVTLSAASLTFTGTTTAAGDLQLTATTAALNIAVATLTFGGNFAANAGGALTQTGPLTVTGTTTLTAGGGLNLPAANTFAQPVAISGTGTMSLNVAGPVALAQSTITGNLALTAAGAITDAGNLSVSGTTTLAAGSTNDITLDNANDFVGTVSITSGGNVALNDTNGFVLGSSNVTGNLSITANGTITDAGGSTVGGTTSLAAGTNGITLDAANDFVGAVTIVSATNATLNDTNSLDLAASTLSGNLSLTAANDITQSGILTVGGNTTLAAGAAGDVTLSLANVFTGSVGVTRANDVTLNDSGPLAIGASTIAGNLSATANGTITDSGAIAVVGVTTLTATANGSITLDRANDFGGPVNAQTGGSIYLNDTGSIELGTVSAASLAVDANGSITDSGVLTIQGDADFYSYSGADITLDEANDFGAGGSGRLQILKAGNVTLNDIDSLAIGQIVASGNLAVTAGGDTTDSGVLNITGTTSLTTPADVILDAANIFGGVVSTTNAVNVSLNAASNLMLGSVVGSNVSSVIAATSAATLTVGTAVGGADITLRGAAIALTGTTTGADVTLNATTGSITGSGLVSGTNLTVDAAQSATLNTSVTSLEATVGSDLTVTAAAGFDINNLTIGNDLAITAAGAITQTTAVTVPGNTSLTAGSNPITLTLTNDFGGPVTVSSASDVSLNDSNALDLAAITASGNLTVTAGGDLTINDTQAITGEADYAAANLAVDAAIGAANVALNATAGVVLFDNLSGARSGSTSVTNTQWLAQAFSTTATDFVLDGVSLRLWDNSGSTTGNFEIQV